jgi:hypothetical protein
LEVGVGDCVLAGQVFLGRLGLEPGLHLSPRLLAGQSPLPLPNRARRAALPTPQFEGDFTLNGRPLKTKLVCRSSAQTLLPDPAQASFVAGVPSIADLTLAAPILIKIREVPGRIRAVQWLVAGRGPWGTLNVLVRRTGIFCQTPEPGKWRVAG